MKKVYFAILALATLTFASCEKDPAGGTAVEKLSGQWYVNVQGIDEKGEVLYEDADLYEAGNFLILTHNTEDNDPTKLFVNDLGNFWDFAVVTKCDLGANSFKVTEGEDIVNGALVTITNGKILFGAATTPSGAKADSIVFDVLFSDDVYAAPNEGMPGFEFPLYDRLRMTGYRYTGFVADED